MRTLQLPSPALVVASIALAMSLGGTAVAAGPAVKRALFADNAGRLQGKSAAQLAALPGPASTAGSLVKVRTSPFTLNAGGYGDVTATCAERERVVSGGFHSDGAALPWDARPTGERTWRVYLTNEDDVPVAGVVYAVCVR